MFSPYEELEYLADHLPDEGEAVLIARESGELVCRPVSGVDLRDGVDDAELYGFLVQANERIHGAGAFPVWMCVVMIFWMTILLHGLVGIGWERWYVVPCLAFLLMVAASKWGHFRQQKLFRREILPKLQVELHRRGIAPYALMAGVRQHGELRSLLDELVNWTPDRERLGVPRGAP